MGWAGVPSVPLKFTLTTPRLIAGVSLVVADQLELGIAVSLFIMTWVESVTNLIRMSVSLFPSQIYRVSQKKRTFRTVLLHRPPNPPAFIHILAG